MRSADLSLIVRTREDLTSGRARLARTGAGIRQADVASVLGVSRSTVGHWETGSRAPSAEHALAYGKLLRQLAKRAA